MRKTEKQGSWDFVVTRGRQKPGNSPLFLVKRRGQQEEHKTRTRTSFVVLYYMAKQIIINMCLDTVWLLSLDLFGYIKGPCPYLKGNDNVRLNKCMIELGNNCFYLENTFNKFFSFFFFVFLPFFLFFINLQVSRNYIGS